MPKSRVELPPAEWQITATTVHCDFVDDFVTIMVSKDWTTKCVWYMRHKQRSIEDRKQKFDRNMRLKMERCQGPECSYVTDYRAKLIKEEFGGK